MLQKLTCAANTTDNLIFQQLINRIRLSGITVNNIKTSSKYIYFDAAWDDTEIPTLFKQKSNLNRAGAKPKKLMYEGKEATCGLVWQFRNDGHMSDAEIGLVLNASESTICRRRKKHLADGNFVENSTVIF